MASLRDIAARANVSVSAVSLVLNNRGAKARISEQTSQKIRKIAEELNYQPHYFARTLRTQRSMLIGVTVWDLADTYFGEILRGIEEVLRVGGYKTLVCGADSSHSGITECMADFQRIRADGVIVVGGSADDRLDDGAERAIPMVLVGRKVEKEAHASVVVDNYLGGRMGALYLLEREYRNLIYLARKERTFDEDERLRGFRSVAGEKSDLVTSRVLEIENDHVGAYHAAFHLLEGCDERIGIFAEDDLIAMGVIRAAQDRQLSIPKQVSVLGFDDLSFSQYLSPRLTTIHQPRHLMGRRAAEIMLRLLPDGNEATTPKEIQVVLQPELRVRESA